MQPISGDTSVSEERASSERSERSNDETASVSSCKSSATTASILMPPPSTMSASSFRPHNTKRVRPANDFLTQSEEMFTNTVSALNRKITVAETKDMDTFTPYLRDRMSKLRKSVRSTVQDRILAIVREYEDQPYSLYTAEDVSGDSRNASAVLSSPSFVSPQKSRSSTADACEHSTLSGTSLNLLHDYNNSVLVDENSLLLSLGSTSFDYSAPIIQTTEPAPQSNAPADLSPTYVEHSYFMYEDDTDHE